MGTEADAWLERLAALWRRERVAARDRFAEVRRGTSLEARVARGLAVAGLRIDDLAAAPGDRMRLWLEVPFAIDLDDVRIGPGDPVRLWTDAPEGDDARRGILSRRDGRRLCVYVDREPAEAALSARWNLDAEAPEATFDRGDRAIARTREARGGSDLARLREVLAGARAPHRGPAARLVLRDRALDEAQQAAVAAALETSEIALIHGPPGTGKTRTLVEIVRQLLARGERVLCAAASNAAVDNLGERLVAAGVPVVRIGHPARVAPALEAHTLDAQITADDGAGLARDWSDEARALRARAGNRADRGGGRDEIRALYARARDLARDARAELARVEEAVLGRARVVLATCAGADHPALHDARFDTVVLDEATQAPDPMALVAIARARRVVLAGDPCQLPPTVIDRQAAQDGLATTIFERLQAAGAVAHQLLIQQHRMHADIMAFPSASMYGGQLIAAPAVAAWTLADLGARPDPRRGRAVWLIDTAGTDWHEERGLLDEASPAASLTSIPAQHAANDPSTRNPGHAARVAAEVRRLLSRPVAPGDVAVIAAYDAQVRLLREHLAVERAAGLEVGTVDGFQGREKEAIVVDLVRSNELGEIGFLADTRRVNVALTRARRFLLIVADSATLGGHPYYGALLEAIDRLDAHGSAWADEAPPLDEDGPAEADS